MRLEISADPFQKSVARGSLRHFHRIMCATEAHAALHQLANNLAPFGFVEWMSTTAIAVNDNGVSTFKSLFVRRPAVLMDLGLNSRHRIEALFQQLAACIELMLSAAMTRRTGQQ